jgi:hypothetical protein
VSLMSSPKELPQGVGDVIAAVRGGSCLPQRDLSLERSGRAKPSAAESIRSLICSSRSSVMRIRVVSRPARTPPIALAANATRIVDHSGSGANSPTR